MRLPFIDQNNKGRAIIIGYLVFCLFYVVPNHVFIFPPRELNLTLIDRVIPFLPWSIVIYLSQFLFLFLALWSNHCDIKRTVIFYAMLLAAMMGALIFFIFPTIFPRSTLFFSGILGSLWQGLYYFDAPTNCFPSLHVCLSILAATLLVFKNKLWRYIAPIWAILISVSTLTTKQHYVIDMIGGVILAFISYYIINSLVIKNYHYEKFKQQNCSH